MEKQMIAFRLDANEHIATGHMFRCVAIARQCKHIGMECIFFLADGSNSDILRREGMDYQVLDLKWDDWNYGLETLDDSLKEYSVKCMIVDSYRVTAHFFERFSGVLPLLYLDDICLHRYQVSAVIHYSEWEDENILAELYQGRDTKVYSGMQYMPLQEKFCSVNGFKEEKRYDLLITTGGIDPYHISLKLLQKILANPEWRDKRICVVLGKMNTDRLQIDALVSGFSNITIMQNITNMEKVMRQSENAVTAAGTTVYELMASGVLFVCFGFSEDQRYFGDRLEQHKNAFWAGDARYETDDVVDNLMSGINKLWNMKKDDRAYLIQKNQKLIDGCGAGRIAEIIREMCSEKKEIESL